MMNWLRRPRRLERRYRPHPKPVPFRPAIELLENRQLLAGNFLGANLVASLHGSDGEQQGLFSSEHASSSSFRHGSLLNQLANASEKTVSTMPANGDVNPYGVAFVPKGIEGDGLLKAGDILVSNFNDKTNTQGTGTTIVSITPDGKQSLFFQGAAGLGLTTALGVLKEGFVIVGNVPTMGGAAQQGSLLIIDAKGKLVTTLTDATLLNGPWDLAINDEGDEAQVFVSNVLSGTVTRIDLSIPEDGNPTVESKTQIASGYAHRTDPNALVIGPTGLAFDPQREILYVASTGDNAIYAISNAEDTKHDHGKGRLIYKDDAHLHGPLGLVLAPNGNLIAANGDAVNADTNHPNELVEFTPKGKFVAQFQLDSGAAGAAFGLAVSSSDGKLRFAAVDDNTNTLHIWTLQQKSSAEEEEHEEGDNGGDSSESSSSERRHHHD
jgi:DNA-binding beta-propeller fold protein YncE